MSCFAAHVMQHKVARRPQVYLQRRFLPHAVHIVALTYAACQGASCFAAQVIQHIVARKLHVYLQRCFFPHALHMSPVDTARFLFCPACGTSAGEQDMLLP